MYANVGDESIVPLLVAQVILYRNIKSVCKLCIYHKLLDDGSENFMCECSPKMKELSLCPEKCQHSWPP